MLCVTKINGKHCYYFDSRYFELNGVQYEITCTKSTGKHWDNTIHTIRSADGEWDIDMKTLVNKILQYGGSAKSENTNA